MILNNGSVLVGTNYSVHIFRCKTKGNITEHWTGKTFTFWLETSDGESTLYESEIYTMPEEVVDMLEELGHHVPHKFYTKEVENV